MAYMNDPPLAGRTVAVPGPLTAALENALRG
jgi:hypothetical protein